MSSPNSKLPNLGAKTEEFISELEKLDTPALYTMTPEKARKFLDNLQEKTHKEIEADVIDTNIFTETAGNVDVRIVRPKDSNNKKLPVILYAHGGGWVIGGKKAFDMLIRKLAVCTNSVVIFPAYALSPEVQYPTAVNQLYAILDYIF